MIVTSVEKGWEIVFQRSHGLLAAQIADAFRPDLKPELWIETLEAIASHDDFKEPFNGHYYVTDLGAPKDFALVSMSAKERYSEAHRRIQEGTREHRWVGLLMSRHVEHLYGNTEETSAAMKELIENERERRKTVLRSLKRTLADLEDAYELLRWCDRCSLILVRGHIPAMGRHIEITHGLKDERYHLLQREDKTLAVDPWPFAADEVNVGVEVHLATQLAFKDDAELIEHLDAGEVDYRKWTFRKE